MKSRDINKMQVHKDPVAYTGKPTLVSLNKPATAMSSQPGRTPDLVVEQNTSNNTYWASPMDTNNITWWQVDLQDSYMATQLVIRNYVDGRYYHYHIRGSLDGVNWFPITSKINNNPATTEGDTYNTAIVTRYLRINVTKNSANNVAHITDFKVYGYVVSMTDLPSIKISSLDTDEGYYATGQNVNLSYALRNDSSSNVTLTSIKVKIFGFARPYFLREYTLATNVTISPNHTYQMSNQTIWTIPTHTAAGAYGVYLQYTLANGAIIERYEHFFRVKTANQRIVYQIDKTSYNGLDVFTLDGGMSAELSVEKSAEMMSAGLSHTWFMNGEGGPNPVYSTPQFLERSVNQTVSFYNNQFGENRVFDTVIISTGNAAVPYVSQVTKAPVLPLHYLVSVDTIKEVQKIMEYSNSHGFPSYAAAGYSRSMPMTGVAWIKMLDLPQAYIQFLNQHQVKNVILMGRTGTTGESTAQKVLSEGINLNGTNPGDVLVLYKLNGTPTDEAWLDKTLKDVRELTLESGYRLTSDWESGVLAEQLDAFTATILSSTGVTAIDTVTALKSDHLYDFATYATLAFMKKNETTLAAAGEDPVRGVAMNPYLISHPFYEVKIHYVPMIYWQGRSLDVNVDVRLNQITREAIHDYFPSIDFDNLKFWIGAARNTAGNQAPDIQARLKYHGLNHIELNDYTTDEEWMPSNGMTSPVEQIALHMVSHSTPDELRQLNDSLVPLTLEELEAIPSKYPNITIVRQ